MEQLGSHPPDRRVLTTSSLCPLLLHVRVRVVVAAHYQVGLDALADLLRGVVVAVLEGDGLLTRTDPHISKCY